MAQNLTVRKGKCINFGNCKKADAKEIIEVNLGDDFICPEPDCGSDLIIIPPQRTWWEKNKKWLLSLFIILAVGGIGYGIYWFVNRPKTDPIVFIKPESETVKIGETVKLTIITEPEEAEKKINWNWTSSDETIATVGRSGVVTGTKEGSVTITVTADKNLSAIASVTVLPKGPEEILVESISLDHPSLSIKVGDSITLNQTVSPNNATNKEVLWSSSDETIASVNNGNVTAVKKGTAVITAKSVDGSEKSAECNVTVVVGPPSPPPPPKYPCGVYKGETSSNGKANGLGTFTYKARTLIDDHKMIYAEQGDYITGTFRDDKIVSVQLFDSTGNLKQTVIPQQPASICR